MTTSVCKSLGEDPFVRGSSIDGFDFLYVCVFNLGLHRNGQGTNEGIIKLTSLVSFKEYCFTFFSSIWRPNARCSEGEIRTPENTIK